MAEFGYPRIHNFVALAQQMWHVGIQPAAGSGWPRVKVKPNL